MDYLMDMLRGIAEIRNPVLDFFFENVTKIGEETVFLVLAIVFFWCIDKRQGYFILFAGLFGTLLNQVMKLIFRLPRPWVIDESFQPVGDSKDAALGYSFPSGHTQNTAITFGTLITYKPRIWKTAVFTALIIIVAFSRMYLGVHTLLDVVASLLIGLVIVVVLKQFFLNDERFNKTFPYIIIASVVMSVAFLVYVLLVKDDPTLDPHNYESALKNACTLLGCTVASIMVWFFDTKITRFTTKASWYAQVIKVVIGLGVVLIIKSGLSTPLTLLFGGNAFAARILRYFLIVAFAGAIWPMTFKWFSNLRIGFLEKFTNFITKKRHNS